MALALTGELFTADLPPDTEGLWAPGTERARSGPSSARAPVAAGASLPAPPGLPAWKTLVKCRQNSTRGTWRPPSFPWAYGCRKPGSFCYTHAPEASLPPCPRGAETEMPLLSASQQLRAGSGGPISGALERRGGRAGLEGPDSAGGSA